MHIRLDNGYWQIQVTDELNAKQNDKILDQDRTSRARSSTRKMEGHMATLNSQIRRRVGPNQIISKAQFHKHPSIQDTTQDSADVR